MAGRGLDDLTVIRTMLQVVPLEHILVGLKRVVDRRLDPRAAPIASWKDERFLEAVARQYALDVLIPSMVAAWTAAGRTLATKAPSSPPAGYLTDIDELRSHHDSEHEPAGPHVMPQPDATPSTPDAPQELASASEAPATVEVSPEPESASTAPLTNGSASSDDGAAVPGPAAEPVSELPDGTPLDVAAAAPAAPAAFGREQILAAFNRNRTLPHRPSRRPRRLDRRNGHGSPASARPHQSRR